MEKEKEMEAKKIANDANIASVEELSDECLDLSDLENVEGGKIVVVGCGKTNGACSLTTKDNRECSVEP